MAVTLNIGTWHAFNVSIDFPPQKSYDISAKSTIKSTGQRLSTFTDVYRSCSSGAWCLKNNEKLNALYSQPDAV